MNLRDNKFSLNDYLMRRDEYVNDNVDITLYGS